MNAKKLNVKKMLLSQVVLLSLILFIVVISVFFPTFLQGDNVRNIFMDMSIYGVVACGMTVLIICGEFDLSSSSQYMWASILFVTLLNKVPVPVAILGVIASGMIWGAINGILVTRFRVNSFTATLGTMIIIRSICLLFTDGKMVSTDNEFIKSFGNATWLGLSSLTYVYIAVLIVISVMLAYTNFGRRIYATGGNIEVARLAGINVTRYKFATFVIMGILCAIGGMMLVSMLRAGSTQYGTDIALTCVAATVIGGTSLSGGSGNVVRTFLGMLVINVLYKALIFLGLQAYYQSLVKGIVLIAVVVLDAYISQSSKARKISA